MSKINKEILQLAIPNIISNISVPLLSTVDTVLMGQLSNNHLGAVGIGSMIFNLIYWNFGFLRMGTTGMTAQAYGRNSWREVSLILARTSLLALLLAVLIFVIQTPLYNACAYLLNILPEQSSMVEEYYRIRLIAAPATFLMYGLMGWLFGVQNAIYPLILTIFINVINMVLSYYLVYEMGYEVAGVAWGTVVSQYCGLLLCIALIMYKYRTDIIKVGRKAILDIKELLAFLNVNSDLFLRTVCLTGAFFFFYSQSSLGGELILATNVVLLLFLNWMSYGIDGFAYAAESMVGKYYGAKRSVELSETIRLSLIWGGILSLIYAAAYGIFGQQLLHLFTSDTSTIAFAQDYMWWMILLPIVSFASYMFDGIYIGLTATKTMRNTMAICFAIYLVVYYVLGGVGYSPHVIWVSMAVMLFLRGLLQGVLYWKYGTELR